LPCPSLYRAWPCWLVLGLLALTSCRSARLVEVERDAPSVQILAVETEDDGAVEVRLLLRNFLDRPLRLGRLQYRLLIDGVEVAAGARVLDIRLGARTSDSTTLRYDAAPAFTRALEAIRRRGQGAYELSGVIEATEPARRIEYRYQGTLSPTPGTERAFR
jgi:hypothetical protein